MNSKSSLWRKVVLLPLVGALLFVSTATMFPKKSEACCSCIQTALVTEAPDWLINVIGRTFLHVWFRFEIHKRLFMRVQFWSNNLSVALRDMGEQLSGVSMQQAFIIGTFMDASYQMETQQVLQTFQARAHKDYHPSVGMCEFISNAKSLADSERKSELNQIALLQRSQDRLFGSAYTSAALGVASDVQSRLDQFKRKFCDPADNNGQLTGFCEPENAGGSPEEQRNGVERFNKDIDFIRGVEHPYTLNVDFTDNVPTEHEEEIMALSVNLYGNSVFEREKTEDLKKEIRNGVPLDNLRTAQAKYMDARSLAAKLSVAENSFNAITGLKSEGTPGAKEFMNAVFRQLDIPPEQLEEQLDDFIGERPSYYAQMDVLTKKLLQSPEFYTNLYDKPANVERKGAALQAIGLMQKFDLFKSHLRNEANLSVLLELAVTDLQFEIENEVKIKNKSAPGARGN